MSQAALVFAVIYTTYVTLMYTIQLASAIPLSPASKPEVIGKA